LFKHASFFRPFGAFEFFRILFSGGLRHPAMRSFTPFGGNRITFFTKHPNSKSPKNLIVVSRWSLVRVKEIVQGPAAVPQAKQGWRTRKLRLRVPHVANF